MIKSRRVRLAGHVARMGRRGMHIGYWWECQKEREHWEDQDVGVWAGMEWIDLAQDRDRWRTFVNTVMNLPFP
jgi:hypothetical protein